MGRRARGAVLVLVLVALSAAACGGDGGGGESKDDWYGEHRELISAFSRSLGDGLNTINQGERTRTLSTCTQVIDDAKEVQEKALPVPNPAVDGPLRKAVDEAIKAGENCLKGGRQTDARAVEAAQVQFTDARKAMDEAEAAINVWE